MTHCLNPSFLSLPLFNSYLSLLKAPWEDNERVGRNTGKEMGESSGGSEEGESGPTSCRSTLVRRRSFVSLGSGAVVFSCWSPGGESRGHFLDECCLCRRPLGRFRDIFMYRGDTPFCSEECRQEQIALDEAGEEKVSRWSLRGSRGVPERAAAVGVQSVRSHAAETAAA